jgi:hypothetical protein
MVKKRAYLNTRKEEILYGIFYAYSAIPGTISSFFSCGERSEAVILLTGIVLRKQSPIRAYFGCGRIESREVVIKGAENAFLDTT